MRGDRYARQVKEVGEVEKRGLGMAKREGSREEAVAMRGERRTAMKSDKSGGNEKEDLGSVEANEINLIPSLF